MSGGQGTVVLKRRKRGYRDMIRAYGVHLDGEQQGKIKRGQTVEFPLDAGEHRIELKLDWCSSLELDFELRSGDRACFYCYPNAGHLGDVPEVVRGSADPTEKASGTVGDVLTATDVYIALFQLPDETDLIALD